MTIRDCIVGLTGLLACASASAGVVLHEVQTGDAPNGRPSRTEMELSGEGAGLRSDFLASDSPLTPAGSYMLFPDERTIYLVNPARKTYMRFDPGMAAAAMKAGSGNPTATENLVMDKKVDEAGPAMLGLPTQHVVWEVSYRRSPPMQIPGFTGPIEIRERLEIWATRGFDARFASLPALKSSAFRAADAAGAGAEPKEVGDAVAGYGFVLKKVVTMESRQTGGPGVVGMYMRAAGGGAQKRTSSMMVTAIRDETLPPERFALPQGYAEVSMMNANLSGMPDLSTLPGGPSGPQQPGQPQPPGNTAPAMPNLNEIPK